MTYHVALLGSVNVGGNSRVAMADLRDLARDLGLNEPQTLLQSGNLVFQTKEPAGAALEKRLEAAAAQRLGLTIGFFVRSAEEWAEIIARNPFAQEAADDPSHLLVQFLKTAPAASAVTALQAAITGPERVRASGAEAYVVYPDGIGRSKLTGPKIEAKLGPATGRNWNTILKLGALAGL
ncbi:MAG TPA: DUF1697 domain-containing protein [Aliidongia sp.]|uniref:DUF1697 domain-containing protein n=1 Tax=Aliidongia sp. TaxID=1914230 RepID=UPI002DDD791E|nr:DUF1697 domain-containing protein [Aliidongia sp.]HEV2678213.1 DUF1697 domain-containing protein [Aliidongia sp.]